MDHGYAVLIWILYRPKDHKSEEEIKAMAVLIIFQVDKSNLFWPNLDESQGHFWEGGIHQSSILQILGHKNFQVWGYCNI